MLPTQYATFLPVYLNFPSPKVNLSNSPMSIKQGKFEEQLPIANKISVFFRTRVQENFQEINLTKVFADSASAIQILANASKIAETAEKVIESALQPLLNNSKQSGSKSP